MSQVLYRKYRAKDFNELIGLKNITDTITSSIKNQNFPHAYLFSGAKGTGKTSLARIIAKAINCENPKNGNPCNECKSCISITNGKFLDLVEIDAASNRGINEIRALRDQTNFLPSEGKYKTFIIDEAHMLTNEAFNALLKTLEEPPEYVVFILATTEGHKIPATISSRCQRYSLNTANKDHIKKKLEYIIQNEDIKIEPEAINLIIANAQGSYRDAESILDKVIGLYKSRQDKITLDEIESLLGLVDIEAVKNWLECLFNKDTKKAIEILNKVVNEGKNLSQFIKQTLEACRNELILNFTENKKQNTQELIRIIELLSIANSQLKDSPIPQLPIEIAIVKICNSEPEITKLKGVINRKSGNQHQKKFINNISTVKGAIKSIPQRIIAIKNKDGEKPKEINLDKLNSKWDKIIQEIKPFNNHLSAFLKKSRVKTLVGNKIILEVPYKFHKLRIESTKSRNALEIITKKILGKSLYPVCEINPKIAPDIKDLDKEDTNNNGIILEVFGDLLE